jgi:hypothetical protein
MLDIVDIVKHCARLTQPFQTHVDQRAAFAAKQVDKRSEFISDSELTELALDNPVALGTAFKCSPTLHTFARVVHAYLGQSNNVPTSQNVGDFAQLNSYQRTQNLRRACDLSGSLRFRGEVIGTALYQTGASNSNVLEALELYPELNVGMSAIQRNIWIPKIDESVGWLSGIMKDSNIPSKGKQKGLMMALSAKVSQRNFVQNYLQPAFEQMFNYNLYYHPTECQVVPFSKQGLANTDISVADKTIVSYFVDVLGMQQDKSSRGLLDDRFPQTVRNMELGGIIDWFGSEVTFQKSEGNIYPVARLRFGERLPSLAEDVAELFDYKISKDNVVHVGTGDTLVEKIITYGVKNPKIIIPAFLWASQKYLQSKN